MTTEEKLEKAFDLLKRATGLFEETEPDKTWFKEYFLLTGQHMILTDYGWEGGCAKPMILEEWSRDPHAMNPILDEVNRP